MDFWHRMLAQNQLPGAGCFKATYPSTQWTRIACSTPPRVWYPVLPSRRRTLANLVGNGHDYTADTNPNLISTSIGTFPKVKGVTSVETVGGGVDGLNSYTLQLNSDLFATAACGSIPDCEGWEQFVFANPPGAGPASLFIQDWLIATGPRFSGCPPDSGWGYIKGDGCVQNSPISIDLATVSITDLGALIETGAAASSGDSIFLSVGSTEFGMKVQGDGITDLSEHWMGAEFNVIGNGNRSTADFNSGSKITVDLQTNDGLTKKPTCPPNSGTTGEKNNLFFVKAPVKPEKLQYPSIEFTMQSASNGSTPSCDTVDGT